MRIAAHVLFLLVALLDGLVFLPVHAQDPGLVVAGDDDAPVVIEAENGLEWTREQRRFVARGHATAVRGDATLRADTLFAFYDDDSHNRAVPQGVGSFGAIRLLEAHGSVVMTAPGRRARGEKAVYDVVTGALTLFGQGKGVVITLPQDTITARDTVHYDSRSLVATAKGDARVVRQDRIMSADTMVARMGAARGVNTLKTVDATGNVRIVTPHEQGTGDRGHYDAVTGIATLTGTVTLVRDGTILTGNKAVFDMNTGVSRLVGGPGRARAVLVPEKPVQDGQKSGSDEASKGQP